MKTFNLAIEAHNYSVINPNETVECKSYQENGNLCKSYQENGNLWKHSFYVDGNRHGEYKSYYSDGNISVHCFYVDGKRHGEYKSYYSDGQLDEHGFYISGKKIKLDYLTDGSYKSKCILITIFDGNVHDI